MRFILLNIFFVLCFQLNAQNSNFDINSSTIFFSNSGQKITFKDFVYITSNYENSIEPKFNASGELEYVVLNYPSEANQFLGQRDLPRKTYTQPKKYNNKYHSNYADSDTYSHVKDLEGRIAPHFRVFDQNNNEFDIEKNKGKVVLLKFWFSKCAPCIEEMPALNQLVNKYRGKGVQFIAPSVERKSLTENFLFSKNFNYNVIFAAQDVAALYKTPGYPTHVLIGKDGVIRKVVVGKRTNIFKILDEEIERALLIGQNDVDVLELDENESFVLNDFTIIYDDKNNRLSKEEYIYKLNTGDFKVFKRVQKDGNTHLLLTKKN